MVNLIVLKIGGSPPQRTLVTVTVMEVGKSVTVADCHCKRLNGGSVTEVLSNKLRASKTSQLGVDVVGLWVELDRLGLHEGGTDAARRMPHRRRRRRHRDRVGRRQQEPRRVDGLRRRRRPRHHVQPSHPLALRDASVALAPAIFISLCLN